MKPINLLGAAAALVLAATPAFAVDWVYVSSDSAGAVHYYDSDTIRRSGSQVTVWTKTDHSRDKRFKWRAAMARYRYDCAERTRTVLHSTNYYPNGESESYTWKTYEQNTIPIVPRNCRGGDIGSSLRGDGVSVIHRSEARHILHLNSLDGGEGHAKYPSSFTHRQTIIKQC